MTLWKTNKTTIASRLLCFLLIWWTLTDGAVTSWIIGAPAVLCALVISMLLLPPTNIVWWRVLTFLPFFFWQSIKGGVDVAILALQPTQQLTPELIEYPLQLSSDMAQVAMITITSLLPGTLSAKIVGGALKVHVLNSQSEYLSALQALERQLIQIFPNPNELMRREDF